MGTRTLNLVMIKEKDNLRFPGVAPLWLVVARFIYPLARFLTYLFPKMFVIFYANGVLRV